MTDQGGHTGGGGGGGGGGRGTVWWRRGVSEDTRQMQAVDQHSGISCDDLFGWGGAGQVCC